MSTGILHTHILVVTLFLLFLVFKTLLLLIGKVALLERVRAKTKVVDMVLGLFLLITGLWLVFLKGGMAPYLIIKVVAVLMAIPLGIIGLKKHSKILASLSVLLLVYVYGVAETKSHKFKKDKISPEYTTGTSAESVLEQNEQTLIANGKALYTALCVECHGEDGQKQLFMASNLRASAMTREEMTAIIANGKGTMPKFDDQLATEDIETVISYLQTLK